MRLGPLETARNLLKMALLASSGGQRYNFRLTSLRG
jgi:hypothetical protein